MATAKPGFATQAEAYAALIQAGASTQVATILAAVTRPESSGYTYATNNYQGNQYLGLWQIGSMHGFDNARLRSDDINYQAQAALQVYRQQGFGAWETYTNGAYQKYLNPQTNTALALAYANQTSLAASIAGASAQGASEGAQQAVAKPLLDATPTAIDQPGSAPNPTSAPATAPSPTDAPGAALASGAPNPLDAPGGNSRSPNPIDGPVGFDLSTSPSGA